MLTGITTTVADMPMLHETVVADGIASMPDVMLVPVPAGGTIALEPGGFHAVLIGLTGTLEKGATFPVTLTFRHAGAVTVDVEIPGMGGQGARVLTRRTVLTAATARGGCIGFMLALGRWRSPAPVAPGLLPRPLAEMQFTLTDHRGTITTPQDWLGRPLLAFFGFTFGLDIRPTTVSDISGWREVLGTDAERLTVALISVDPE